MGVSYSATPWPSGSSHHNPPLDGIFIPEVWSAVLISNLWDRVVVPQIANSKWQSVGERGTNKIIVPTRPVITIKDYSIAHPLEFERPSAPAIEINLDQALYFAAILDDVLKVQSNYDLLQIWMEEAAMGLKVRVDTTVLGGMTGVLDPNNAGATAGVRTAYYNLGTAIAPRVVAPEGVELGTGEIDIMSLITNMTTVLDEQAAPPEDRYLVVPPWVGAFIRRSKDFRSAETIGDSTSAFRTGQIGVVENMPVYVSNLLPSAVVDSKRAWYMYMGQERALTYIWQLNQMHRMTAQQTMGELIRGLYVFGYKVTEPKLLAAAYVTPKAGTT